MKPLKVALTPTGNRRLNELVGVSLIAMAGILVLSLVSYRPTDPSLNTVGSAMAHNWAGIFGATLSDLLFQFEGFAAFCLPLMLGLLGLSWIRSRAIGAPISKVAGFALFLFIIPAVFGSAPRTPALARRHSRGGRVGPAFGRRHDRCAQLPRHLRAGRGSPSHRGSAFHGFLLQQSCANGSRCASPSSMRGATAGAIGSFVAQEACCPLR